MIYFKSIKIQNYKGFTDSGDISLSIPDGKTPGSGLNIFVGENGSGKTTVLKAISMITSQATRNKIASCDFNNKSDLPEIRVEITPSQNFKYKLPLPFRRTLDIKQFVLTVKHRTTKSPGKMFSDMFQVSNIAEPTSRSYETKQGENTISDYFLQFDPQYIDGDDLNIFYFDRTRYLQTRAGYSSTLSRALEDLNWKFLSTANQGEVLKQWTAYYDAVVTAALGSEITKEIAERFQSSVFEDIKIELLNLKEPFLEAFFAKSDGTNLSQIPLSELGSGVELIFAILFLKRISSNSKGTIIYCIDEPELSLHPQWQKALFELLKDEAKDKQIFIATHSPHFIDASTLSNVKRFSCDDDNCLNMNSLPTSVTNDQKTLDLFNLENREIFFARATILVEGWEDKDRIRKFLQTNNNDLFVIVGLQNFSRVQKVCQSLVIPFKAIVDLDYLRNYSDLIPDLEQNQLEALEEVQALDELISSTQNEIVKKEATKIKSKLLTDKLTVLSSKIKTKMASDQVYAQQVSQKIEFLKTQSSYVLPNGVIEDYLEEDGKPKSEKLGSELLAIIKA